MRLSKADVRLINLVSSLRSVVSSEPSDADLAQWLMNNDCARRASRDVLRFLSGGAGLMLAEAPKRKRLNQGPPPTRKARGVK